MRVIVGPALMGLVLGRSEGSLGKFPDVGPGVLEGPLESTAEIALACVPVLIETGDEGGNEGASVA